MESKHKKKTEDVGFLFYVDGEPKTEEEYGEAYLVPIVGQRKAKSCIRLIKVQLLYVWLGRPVYKVLPSNEGTTRCYLLLSDYNLRVFYKEEGSLYHVYEVVA